MMSTPEGGEGSWKSRCSEGSCMSFILQISSKCRQVGRGSKKAENIADIISGRSLREGGPRAAGQYSRSTVAVASSPSIAELSLPVTLAAAKEIKASMIFLIYLGNVGSESLPVGNAVVWYLLGNDHPQTD